MLQMSDGPDDLCSDAMAVDHHPAGRGWRGGFYVVQDDKPLLGPSDSNEEAVGELALLKASLSGSRPDTP